MFKAIAVETGSSNGSSTEILSGLKEGDEIITEFVLPMEEMSEEGQGQGNNNPFMPRRPNRQQRRGGQGGSDGNSGSGPGGNSGGGRPGGSGPR